MYISGYCVEVASDGTITSTKTNESECSIDTPQVTTYANGTVVYYNPETNTKCTSAEAVSTTGTKTGCMRWYAFNYDGSDKVNLLLDHDTTAAVLLISPDTRANGLIEVKKQLKSDTSTWNKSINPRLIEASEVAKITNNTAWTAGGSFYYFHTNSTTQYQGAAGTNKYAWLFDNTYDCTTYGCNVANSSTYGYWTNTANSINSYYAWNVYYNGYLLNYNVARTGDLGVRPVITILKSKLR